MKTFYARDRARAEQVFNLLRPEGSQMARNRFLNQVDKHVASDYSEGLGLKLLGLSGNRCVPYVEIHEDNDTGWDVDWMVAVDVDGSWEAFDKSEASGYDVYIKAAPHRAHLEAAVKQAHISKRIQEPEPCEESAQP